LCQCRLLRMPDLPIPRVRRSRMLPCFLFVLLSWYWCKCSRNSSSEQHTAPNRHHQDSFVLSYHDECHNLQLRRSCSLHSSYYLLHRTIRIPFAAATVVCHNRLHEAAWHVVASPPYPTYKSYSFSARLYFPSPVCRCCCCRCAWH